MATDLHLPLLESLIEGMPAFFFSVRRGDLGLLSVSGGVSTTTGFEARDLLAQPWLWVGRIPPADRERFARLVGNVAGGSLPDEEFRFLCADGKIRPFRLRMTPVHGPPGSPPAVAGVAWAEEEARNARKKANRGLSILRAAGAAIFFVDLAGRVRLWNDACERILGWSRGEVVGGAIHRLFPIPAEAVDALLRTAREEGHLSREIRISAKDGGSGEFRIVISRASDEGGAPFGFVVHATGTAERRGLESRLEELVNRLRTIERVNRIITSDWDIRKAHGRIAAELDRLIDFDRTSIAVFEEGKDPVLIRAHVKGKTDLGSGAVLSLSDSAPGWVLARRTTRIDDDIESAEERFAENALLAREGMRSRLMIPLFVGDRIVGTLNFNSRKRGAYTLSDVEELGSIPDQLALAIDKYQTYARIGSSEEKYRLLFEQGPPAATVGRDGRFVDVNEGCLRLYGYSREEFLRLRVDDVAAFPEEDEHHAVVLSTGTPLEAEVVRRRKDGTHFFGLLNVFPVSGNLVLGQIIDITAQRELEDRLRHAQKMEAVGTLAGGIAHDFNNIIQAILGYASLMKARSGGSAEGREELDAIERAGMRAAELATQLLGFARGGKYEVRPTDFNGVVEKVVSMIRHTFDRSIDVRTALAPDLRTVEGDAGQLEHTLLNLCINARDAMPDGGVLRIETRNDGIDDGPAERFVGAAERPEGGCVSVSVSDTGMGIPPGDLPRIFEPFFTTKEPGKGTGMGLAMAYGIVKNHGGHIDVRSEIGGGTTFRVTLPASRRTPAPQAPPKVPETLVGGTETILFIDDEESLRHLAVEMLGSLGYAVLTAPNGAEGCRIVAGNRGGIDLVILDMIMPGMGGEETFRRIKEIEPSARVLVSSGYAVEGKPGTLLAEGASGFLPKPYRLAALAAAVRRALSG